MKTLVLCFWALLLCGCDGPDFWEFQVCLPSGTPIEQLMEIRDMLKAKGYKRTHIVPIDYGRAIQLSATESEARQ